MIAPKDRDALIHLAWIKACNTSTAFINRLELGQIIEAIESLGVAIVPKEPTEEMRKAVWDTISQTAWEENGQTNPEALLGELRAAIAASPFAKRKE